MTNPLNLHPVDWYTFYGSFASIFDGLKSGKDYHLITPERAALMHPDTPNLNDLNTPTFIYHPDTYLVEVVKTNEYRLPVHSHQSKFALLSAIRFKGSHQAAMSYIQQELIGEPVPYIRVGCDYYKVIKKLDRYGAHQTEIKAWKKDEIKQDHPGKSYISSIPLFDDFIMEPNNDKYTPVIENCFNLYSKFSHVPSATASSPEIDFPITWGLINHIFSAGTPDRNQIPAGLKYLKCLYEHPKQILPILVLVSEARETGKTTFINWLQMIFGSNYVAISPEALTKSFNANYAYKNIIAFEEAFVDKQPGIEKLKYLSTGKFIDVSQKWVSQYSIPFFGKFIMCTNRVLDFMRIDREENRFWVRPIPKIPGKRNSQIETQLFKEIPAFLRYLKDLPPINFATGSRTLLTADEIYTDALENVKKESHSGLFKEIEMHIEDYFNANDHIDNFLASAADIKKEWFNNNNQITMAYIRKVLIDEAKMDRMAAPEGGPIKYWKFGRVGDVTLGNSDYCTGNPFKFVRINHSNTLPDAQTTPPF